MADHFAPADPQAPLNVANKLVMSRSLQAPLSGRMMLVAEDAVDAIPRLKAESPVPLRGHGIAMNRALLAAGVVDRLEVTLFPIVNGATGSNPVLAGLPDIDLSSSSSSPLDGRVQRLAHSPPAV